MARLPTLKATQLIKALEKASFKVVRSSGSHHWLVHTTDASRATTVPIHSGRNLPRALMLAIIKQAGLTTDELNDLL